MTSELHEKDTFRLHDEEAVHIAEVTACNMSTVTCCNGVKALHHVLPHSGTTIDLPCRVSATSTRYGIANY